MRVLPVPPTDGGITPRGVEDDVTLPSEEGATRTSPNVRSSPKLVDGYGRPINSLRIALTQRCNLSCIYCHHEGEVKKVKKEDELTPTEIYKICRCAKELGVRKLKLTGGEPLMRDDIVEIVKELSSISFKEISMTTNGTRLSEMAAPLKRAGLDRVNVSMDTLNEKIYKRITGGKLSDVVSGVDAAVFAGLTPVKLNIVVLRGFNDALGDIEQLMTFASRYDGDVSLQLIEPLSPPNPPTKERHDTNYSIGRLNTIEDVLARKAEKVSERSLHRRRRYYVDGVTVEVVRPMNNSVFCANCTRLRLTSDGNLRGCLLSQEPSIPIKGLEDDGILEVFKEVTRLRKPYFLVEDV
ncbi:MAG: GTP 3',8-cyclase MoaA [Methermicoccaceae archaeon]